MNKPSRPLRHLALAVAMAGLVLHPAGAEDIDLYVSGSADSNAPNVLLYLDNTSNWSANNQAWSKATVLAKCGTDTVCQGYVTQVFGANADLTQGQVELRALKLVLNELVCNAANPIDVRVGLMLLSDAKGTADGNGNASGYIRRAVKTLDASYCTTIINDLDFIDSKITNPDFKADSSSDYGSGMYEAFKYFGGYANPAQAAQGTGGSPSGRTGFGPQRYVNTNSRADPDAFQGDGLTYASPITADNACGKNYIILVGNTWPNQEYGSNTNANPPSNTLMTRLGYSTNQIYSVPQKANIRFADEWAQFLAGADVSSVGGQQSIYTYTLNVYNASADANQTALLKSMATVGGTGVGGYFEVGGNLKTLIDAFKDIFTQIASVNSVFASASLPVSVNTQGTYLNQVFIGMFRPDSDARPRWAGNLKQYQFSYDESTQSLFLADADGDAAVDNANTGFIGNCARSFWTTDSGTYWQDVPANETPAGTCLTSGTSVYSDSPDGNLVEKGGSAQKLRGLTPSTRNIKTCTDSNCGSLVDFNTTNMSATEMGVANDTARDTLVNWLRGQNLGDGSGADPTNVYATYSKATTGTRPTIHGDVVHSRPLAINYGSGNSDDVVVFYGSGDGMLRAVDGNQTGGSAGNELWSFIAPEFWTRLNRLRENKPKIAFPTVPSQTPTPTKKDYFFDGGIGAYQERALNGSVSALYLYPSMRRGGRMIYAFNATSRPNSSAPTLMWRFGCPNLTNDTGCVGGGSSSSIGQTWSTPRVILMKDDNADATDNPKYVVFGGGYDACEDDNSCSGTTKGQGVYVINATSGGQAAYINLNSVSGVSSAGRVIADVVPVDVNADGYTDVLYIVDTRGHLFRINVSDPSNAYEGLSPGSWQNETYLLATVADWGSQSTSRKFSYAPDVITLGGTNIILGGTGDREQPLEGDFAAGVRNRFYQFRDNFDSTPTALTATQSNCDGAGDTTLDTGCELLNVTTFTLDYTSAVLTAKGWFIDLDRTTDPREQVLTTPVTAGGVTYFSTFQPTDGSAESCSNLGTARGYALNFLTGSLRSGDTQRSSEFLGGGIPPSPVAGVVQIGDQKVPFIIGGKPTTGTGSAIEALKVPIDLNVKRKKVYRIQRIE